MTSKQVVSKVMARLGEYFDPETAKELRNSSSPHELCDMLMKAADISKNGEDVDLALELYEALPAQTIEEVEVNIVEDMRSVKQAIVGMDVVPEGIADIAEAAWDVLEEKLGWVAAHFSTVGEPEFPQNGVGLYEIAKVHPEMELECTHLVSAQNVKRHVAMYAKAGWVIA